MSIAGTRILAVPVLFGAVVMVAAVRQPQASAIAYSGAGTTVYVAQVLSSAAATLPARVTVHRALAVLPGVPSSPSAQRFHPITTALAVTNAFDVRGKPSISVQRINNILAAYSSPMAGEGQQLYDLGVKYGIDPAFCLAFFVHESAAGTRGEAVLTHNLGNIRSVPGAPSLDGYRYFDTWLEGAAAWYQLISSLYVADWGLTTVDRIIPVYAPSADSNDPTAYIDDVQQMVSTWRALH